MKQKSDRTEERKRQFYNNSQIHQCFNFSVNGTSKQKISGETGLDPCILRTNQTSQIIRAIQLMTGEGSSFLAQHLPEEAMG